MRPFHPEQSLVPKQYENDFLSTPVRFITGPERRTHKTRTPAQRPTTPYHPTQKTKHIFILSLPPFVTRTRLVLALFSTTSDHTLPPNPQKRHTSSSYHFLLLSQRSPRRQFAFHEGILHACCKPWSSLVCILQSSPCLASVLVRRIVRNNLVPQTLDFVQRYRQLFAVFVLLFLFHVNLVLEYLVELFHRRLWFELL